MNDTARQSWMRRAGVVSALAVVVLFYFWTATTSEWPVRPAKDLKFYYGHLANAYLAGQLHLLTDPSPELLALSDPYDPRLNHAIFRFHDAVLFDRKYYLYNGPTPALLLYVPFRAVTGLDFTDPLAVPIFCSVGLVFAFLLVQFLCRAYLPETPFGLVLAAVPALAFGSVAPFLLRRPNHYEVSIAAGYALAFASAYYFAAGALGPRVKRGYVALGSLLLGLAGGARFPMLATGLVAAVLALYVLIARREEPLRGRMLTVAAFVAPVAVCVFLLGLYNYLRFGSWTEFGISYTLQGYESARTYKFYSLARLPAGLFYYLLAPPRFDAVFPFIHLDPGKAMTPPADFYLEPVGGILVHTPLLGILLFAPVALFRFRRSQAGLYLVGGALLVIGLVLLALFALAAGTMRYEVDFATFLVVPALLLWYAAVNALGRTPVRRRLLVWTFALLLTVTVVFNAAFSLVGYGDNLKNGSPDTYEAIHNTFRPLERWLGQGS